MGLILFKQTVLIPAASCVKIAIRKGGLANMTYTFKVSLQEEEDGRWSPWIDSLPGCADWE